MAARKKVSRKTAARKESTGQLDETELRRWCIEQAIRWPTTGPYGAGLNQYQPQHEADVLGRAKRILTWVLTP